MTDAEVICNFMEPKPKWLSDQGTLTEGGWWWMGKVAWEASGLTFDEIHEVEARLIAEGRSAELHISLHTVVMSSIPLWHANAEQRIAALAAVLRGQR